MKTLFPGRSAVRSWHKAVLGPDPFSADTRTAAAAFFGPAAKFCRRPVPAEKELSQCIPAAVRRRFCVSLRLWQASQEMAEAYIRGGRLPRGMDMPMTLNFAMALGNYSRHFLFSFGRLGPAQALPIHSAFAREMAAMPSGMSLRRARAFSPAASASRLAAAFSAVFAKGGR